MSAILTYGVSVVAAVAMLWGLTRCFGRSPGGITFPRDAAPDIRVLSRTRVGVGRTLVIVEVEGRRLLLGSTREQWCALADLGSARFARLGDDSGSIEAELARAAQSKRYRGWEQT